VKIQGVLVEVVVRMKIMLLCYGECLLLIILP